MSTLADRVTQFVASNPGLTAKEIARGVTARHESVLDVLASDAFHASPRDAYASDRAQVYRLASVAGERPGAAVSGLAGALEALSNRPSGPTHGDQILLCLVDGREWSSRELQSRVFCVLHSRIAELRRRLRLLGFDIEHSGGGSGTDVHWYRLVPFVTSEAAAVDRRHAAAAASGVSVTDHALESVEHARALPAGTPVQLQLGEAA